MYIQSDFEDFSRLLESHRVDSMVVGGHAVADHGFPRFTENKRATGRRRDLGDAEELS